MKKLVYLLWIVLSIMIWFWFGCFASDPSFSFKPVSWTEFKLYCESPVYMMLNWWYGTFSFNGFEASILFDTGDLDIIVWSINSEFDMWQKNFLSGNLYNVGWAMAWSKEWSVTWVSFSIISKRNITSSSLLFVDKYWDTPTYWLETTKDGISLNAPLQWSKDILTGVTNTTYNFVALPCNTDNKKPTITNVSVHTWDTNIPSNKVITFVTYDWDGSNYGKVTHWFSGNSVNNLNNYVSAPSNVDNQEWVDSNRIFVTISCTWCSPSQTNVSVLPTISNWNWDTTRNALTWDSEKRWYNVSINPPFPYEVEKQVTVSISVSDNPNEYGQTHTGTHTFSFNKAVAPTITRISPATSTFVSPSKIYPISFFISDDWAWVDTGSVVITTTYSGGEFVYSWSDLNFTLSWWQPWLWNSWKYLVSFYPKENFPVNTIITLDVTWSDLAGSTKTLESSFTTRPECSFFGCIDSVNIIWNGINEIFTWIVLSVTWTNPNSPYPYLTWENDEILMCGKDWSGTAILGNIYLYDASWNRLNNVQYTWNDLFITWLDVIYQDGIIIVD